MSRGTREALLAAALAAAVLLMARGASAQLLKFDPAFHPKVAANNIGFGWVQSIAPDGNGKTLIGGWFTKVSGATRVNIARLNANGTLDGTFAPPSTAQTTGEVGAIAVQPDGKILVGGWYGVNSGGVEYSLLRLNGDGSRDTDFSPPAAVSTFLRYERLALQPDGKVLCTFGVGTWSSGVWSTARLGRLNANGGIDTGFQAGFDSSSSASIFALAVQGDGKVIIGGVFTTVQGTARKNLARLNSNGSLDTSFVPPTLDSNVSSVAVQPDGKILVAGGFTTPLPRVLRLNDDGSLDTSFDPGSGPNGIVEALALSPSGAVLISGGFTAVGGVERRHVARLLPDGGLDGSFNPGSVSGSGFFPAVRELGTGQILLGGQEFTANGVYDCIVRWSPTRAEGASADNPFAAHDFGLRPQRRVSLPEPSVNTTTLTLLLQGTLFSMGTLGPLLDAELTYAAHPDMSSGMFGKWWSFAYESGISHDQRAAVLRTGSGKIMVFTSPRDLSSATSGSPIDLEPPVGVFSRLSYNGTSWVLTEKGSWEVRRYRNASATLARLTTVEDRNGNRITVKVNLATGAITSLVDSANRTLSFARDAKGRCTTLTAPDGRQARFAYDTAGRLVKITALDGSVATYAYDGNTNYLVRATTAGKTTTFTYVNRTWGSGRYLASMATAGETTRYEPAKPDGSEVRRISPLGKITLLKNRDGRTEGVQDPLGNLRSFGYLNNLPASFVDADGGVHRYEHDARGNLLRRTDALGRQTTYEYDGDDNLVRVNLPVDGLWTLQYDSRHNVTRVSSPLGNAATFTYDPQGRLVEYADPLGNRTTIGWDAHGNVTRVTDPLGRATTFAYTSNDAYTRMVRIGDPRGKQKWLEYDDLDRLTKVTWRKPPAVPVFVTNVFDAFAQTAHIDELGSATRAARDAQSFITRLTDPIGNGTSFVYDDDHNRVETVDALSRRAWTAYDDAARPVRSENARHGVVERTYNADGNLAVLRDERNKSWTFAYDANNRLRETRDPLGGAVALARDGRGRVTQLTRARGATVASVYDADGRRTRKDYNGVTEATYAYDAAGNLRQMTDRWGTTGWTYDACNRVTAIAYPDGKAVSFTYDAAGNLATLTYPGGVVASYAYDDLNRVPIPARARNGAGTELRPDLEKPPRVASLAWEAHRLDYSYDAAANPVMVVRSNGTSTRWEYDAAQRLTTVRHAGPEGVIAAAAYVHDATGNAVSAQILPEILPALASGALIASYGDDNRLLGWGGAAGAHDADGNLTALGAVLTAVYDAENRVTSATAGGSTITALYGGNGDRVRTVNGATTVYAHHDARGRLLFETDGAGTVIAMHLWAGNRLVATRDGAGVSRFFHFDRQGNALAVSDASGAVVARYAYTPGGAATRVGAALRNPFTYVGEFGVYDDGNGLLLMRHRTYDATRRRFLQRDPIGFEGGINLYAYARNNPVNWIDPLGLKGKSWMTSIPIFGRLFAKAEEGLANAKPMTVEEYVKRDTSADAQNFAQFAGETAGEGALAGAKLGGRALTSGLPVGLGTKLGGNAVGDAGADSGFGSAPPDDGSTPLPDAGESNTPGTPGEEIPTFTELPEEPAP